jgi:Zn-dependent protease
MSEPRRTATFRPRLGGLGLQAFLLAMLVYLGLEWVGPDIEPLSTHPFGVAAVVGLAIFLGNVLGGYRRQGFRIDDVAIHQLFDDRRLLYTEIETVRISIEDVQFGGRATTVRVVTIEGKGASMRFADLGGMPSMVGDIVNIDTAGLLLATIVARTGSEALYPPAWKHAGEHDEPATSATSATDGTAPAPRFRLAGHTPWSFVALLFKLVPTLGAMALKLLKSIKLGAAAVTIGAYGLIFSWKFALAFVILVGVHECGHVFAMWRSGIKVKGIYFIPFVGGVAVGEGPARSAGRSAYVAINGPVWGTLLACACFAAFVASGERWSLIGAVAAWGALINLLNLMPIMPLDGGRILAALGTSRAWGLPVLVASLILGAALAYLAELELLVLMVLLGLIELGTTIRVAQSGPSLTLLGDRSYGATEHEHFGSMVAPVAKGRTTAQRIAQRAGQFEHFATIARQAPMSRRQVAATSLGYLLLCACLLGMMASLADLEGDGDPLELLR